MKLKRLLLTMTTMTVLGAAAQGQQAPQLRADNIDEVMKSMRLEEKARLLVGGANNFFSQGAVVGGEARLVAGAAGATPAIQRLGIPATVLTDGPAGVRIDPTRKDDDQTYYATGFPIGTCLASTWNTALVEGGGRQGHRQRDEGVSLRRHPRSGHEPAPQSPLRT